MSLISDALARARREAAAREAARLARRLPTFTPPPRRPTSRALLFATLVATIAVGGATLGWLRHASEAPPRTAEVDGTAAVSASAPPRQGRPSSAAPTTAQPTAGAKTAVAGEGATDEFEAVVDAEAPPLPSPTPSPPSGATLAYLPPLANASGPWPGPPTPPTSSPPPRSAPPAVQPPSPTPAAPPTAAPAPPAPHPTTPTPQTPAPPSPPASLPARSYLLEAPLGSLTLRLDYIVYKPSAPFASINGQRVVLGSRLGEAVVIAIEEDAVHLEHRAGRVILRAR